MSLVVEVAARAAGPVDVLGLAVAVTGDGSLEVLGSPARLAEADAARAASLLGNPFDEAWVRVQGFAGKAGQALSLRSAAGPPAVVLVGLGPSAGIDPEGWRRAAAALVRAAGEGATVALDLPPAPPGAPLATIGSALAEGAVLAAYRFDRYRSEPPPPGVQRLVVLSGAGDGDGGGRGPAADRELAAGVRRGTLVAAAVCFARDLVNTPPSDCTPEVLARLVAEELGRRRLVSVEVWDEPRIREERLGGLLAVNRGSAEPPRFVRATYAPQDGGTDLPHVVLVGKGITFDSGGLSLKTAEGMTTMKTDMSGAAVVLGALLACADLAVPVRVSVLAPLTENMPGGAALKPGDVFAARNGATIEVLNTDAEGRLVLADALALAAELDPTAIVDVATLTGAARVALGTGVAALFGTDDALVADLLAAGAATGERLWRLPLPDDYASHIDSDVADVKNTGRSGEAGSIAAAMLLSRFVDGRPWAHLDIAGTGRAQDAQGYVSKGGTAFGLRTLVRLVEQYAAPSGPAAQRAAS